MENRTTKNGFFAILLLLLISTFSSALEGSYILRGDLNWDGQITQADIDYLTAYLFTGGPAPNPMILGDIDGSHTVNNVDQTRLGQYISSGSQTIVGNYKGKAGVLMRGDTNWDGSITSEDASIIANYSGSIGPIPDPKILGDTNGDMKISFTDASAIGIFLNDPSKWLLPIYRGDVNWDGIVDNLDFVYMENALGGSGPSPDPLILGDVNGDHAFDIYDALYLADFLNSGGTPPVGVYAGSSGNPTITAQPTVTKNPSVTAIPNATVTTLPSPTTTGGSTPVPTAPIITGGSSTDTICSTSTICIATHGSGSYCDGGKCTSCQYACIADNKCISCCAKAGRVDPDCSAPTATAAPTPRPTIRQTYTTPTPYVSNYVMEVPDSRVDDVIQEIRDSGEDTSAIEEQLRIAKELELAGKADEAAKTKASAMDKINALFTKVSQNKKSFVWGLAILIIMLIGGAALYNSLKQGGNIENEEQEKLKPNEALKYERVVAETLEENKPFKLDIKEKKKDA